MRPPSNTPLILSPRSRRPEFGDLFSLVMAVIGSTTPVEIVDRLTSFVAGRLNAIESCCWMIDSGNDLLGLICISNAFEPEDRGERLGSDQLSKDIDYLLDRALDWARDGLISRVGESGITSSSKPLPVLRAPLTKLFDKDHRFKTGLLVPVVNKRRVVGFLWVGLEPHQPDPDDWCISLLQNIAAMAGQAIGALLYERRQLELEQQKISVVREQFTRLEKSKERLQVVHRSQGDHIEACSHELRGPLSVVLGEVETLKSATALTSSQKKSVNSIDKQTKLLLAMVDDLLEIRREDPSHIHLEACDVHPLVETWKNEFTRRSQKTFSRLLFDVGDNLGIRRVDPQKLKKISASLLDAAMMDTPGARPMHMEVAARGDFLSITVSELTSASNFDEEQARTPTKTSLGSVLDQAQRLGGEVQALVSEKGTIRYSVLIPAVLEPSEAAAPKKPSKLGRVMLIDPDKEALYKAAAALSTRYEVLTARTEREACWLLQQYPIDCALVDLNFPLMTGFATAAELRRATNRPELPILFSAERELSGAILRRQGDLIEDMIVKPIKPDVLLGCVEAALEDNRGRGIVKPHDQVDTLTGLCARPQAVEQLEQQVNRSLARPGYLSLLLLKVDDLPELARLHGAAQATGLINEMAVTLKTITRANEVSSHWGDDVFSCILPNTPEPAAQGAGNRLRERLIRCHFKGISSKVLVGGATLDPRHPISAEMLISMAEEALESARQRGGERVVVYSSGPESAGGSQWTEPNPTDWPSSKPSSGQSGWTKTSQPTSSTLSRTTSGD